MGGREGGRGRERGGGEKKETPIKTMEQNALSFLDFLLLLLLPASSSLSLAAARSPWRSPRARSVLAPLKSPKSNMLRQIPLGLREHEERNQMNPQEKIQKIHREKTEREREREKAGHREKEKESRWKSFHSQI